ncbi:choice-of-anchor Q domain-containing protein [Aerolutibacter daejeonensis]|uniref:choice-of-anchor Q domain-containing protein n=1 Tax=Aerolutibacter daejeonensis TaxID=346181 RepID=UPI0018DC693E|nr:choice-of-anchor Q domain-containing protein [Lysobacter daejeonensis]
MRTDGGDASQCNGLSNAAYPGSGTGQSCAWKSPIIALPASGSARIAGGDTLRIVPGTYQLGSGGYMQPIPSGPSRTSKTVVVGYGGTPKLVGVGGAHRVLNLDGSSNVEVGNLEITDNSDCVYGHSVSSAACTSSMPWARVGLYARASNYVWLHDLNIHGLGARGINAGGLSNWTMERLKINKNGSAGWEGNIGTGGSNSGNMVMRDIEIAWNGCGERVSTGEPWACWAQQTGGYGDGFGTTDTGGNWLIEDAFIHHNTSDGLDMRYMDGADTTKVTLRRVYSVANAGNQVKIKGNSVVENSVLVGQCTYFRGKYYMTEGDLCRAYGSSLLLIMTGNDTATIRHNTIAGEGDAQIAYGEGTSTDKIFIQNNLVVGFPYYANASNQTLFSGGGAPAAKSFSGNMGWKVRSCPTGATCTQDPQLRNMTLASFDAEPLSGSPVIDKVTMNSAVNSDFLLQPRPSGSSSDVGAYEVQAGGAEPTPTPTPTPTCTRGTPTVGLTGPTTAVAAGTANKYSVSVKNNDSSGCSNTTFSLARSVPSGWTGTLSTTGLALAPGASGSAVLTVTSPGTASAGTYGIGVGTSSSVGSTHTANASATYTVAAPAGMTEALSTSKSSYKAKERVYITARVMRGTVPVSGASVDLVALKPNNINTIELSGKTDSNGYVTVSFISGSGTSSIGTYKVTSTATSGTDVAKATTSFSVYK